MQALPSGIAQRHLMHASTQSSQEPCDVENVGPDISEYALFG